MELKRQESGCSDADVTRRLSALFNRRTGMLHLCVTHPCTREETYGLHVTRFRRFSIEGFKREYLTAYMSRQITKWLEEDGGEDEEENADPGDFGLEDPGGLRPILKAAAKTAAKSEEEPPPEEGEEGEPRPGSRRPKKTRREKEKEEASREELRKRLDTVRSRLAGETPRHTPSAPRAGKRAVHVVGDDDVCLVSSSPGYSASLAPELTVGNELNPAMQGLEALEDGPRVPPGGEAVQKKKKKKRKKDASQGTGPLAIRGGTMSGLQKQLVQRAAENAVQKEKKKKEEERRGKPKNAGEKLLKILTDAIQPKKNRSDDHEGTGKKKKKKKKSKKRDKKRRVKRDPDGDSSPNGSSPTSSSCEGSDRDWEESSSSSSKGKYEPPLKRKSQQHPGSVLKLLVARRAQLDQTSKVTVDKGEEDATQGVKLSSYFIVLKPQVQGAPAALRELHFLSHSMDLLRSGQLDKLGDVMASRFIAVHQSAIDGGWGAAKHLELLPMEEVSAAGTSVVLQARRHARIAARAANQDGSGWKGANKGKGGKGRYGSQEEWHYEGKGKGRKGEKGKTKGKPWWGQSQNQEGDGWDANKKKEKPGDKA